MFKSIDRLFGGLMLLAICGHTTGTFLGYPLMSTIFVWSLSASLAGALVGVLNILRAGRPHDRTLAAITAIGTIGWLLVALGFGQSIGNLLDPRAMGNAIIALVLVIFSGLALQRTFSADSSRTVHGDAAHREPRVTLNALQP